jgi:hypothetical protein
MNIPNVEFIGKLLTFIGLGLISIAIYYFIQNNDLIKIREYNNKIKLIDEEIEEREIRQRREVGRSIDFEITSANTFDSLNKLYRTGKLTYDELNEWLNNYWEGGTSYERFINSREEIKSIDSLTVERQKIKSNINKLEEANFYKKYLIVFASIVGFLILYKGITAWSHKEKLEKYILLRQNLEKPTFSEHCQSCGRTFNSILNYGTNKDGSMNYHFCCECYSNGIFTEPNLSFNEIFLRTKAHLVKTGIKGFRRDKILKRLNLLDRWRVDQYY